jgi:potassium/hydrogen antiporter
VEKIMLGVSVIILISVFSTKLSKRFNVPLLIIFLIIGMLSGSEGIGKIYFDDSNLAYVIATLSLCFILFSGGLETQVVDIKPVLREGTSLSILGVLLNALFFAFPIYFLTRLNLAESFLASATVASTDAATVFFLLKFNKINLKYKLRNILEFESGSNDPMAYVLVLVFISVVQAGGGSFLYYVIFFFRQMLIGLAMGFICGYLSGIILKRLKLKIEELYSVVLVGILLLTFSATNLVYGNGFLAIYILGIMIRSKKYLFKNSTLKFFSVISWFMQMTLFICLGLLVFPSKLVGFTVVGIILALILVFVVRPLSVFATLYFFGKKLNTRSKLYISWGGLKGAVPIVFAIFVKVSGIPNADIIFNLIFFIVIVSVLIQGTTLACGAKFLKLNTDEEIIKDKSETEELEYFEDQMLELNITDKSIILDKHISEINLPEDSLITLIKRGKEYIHPNGRTKIRINDKLIIMCKNKIEFFNFVEEMRQLD